MQSWYVSLIRWAFTRFYREFAWTYDGVAAAVSGGQWSTWPLAALPFLEGRVLELGCGTGNLQRALAGTAYEAVGIDSSRQMLAHAQRKVAATNQHPRLAQADAGRLPFSAQMFATLVATFPSEYIVAPATIAEAQRVLQPNGQIIVILGAQFRTSSLYRRAVDLLYCLTLQRPIIAPEEPAAPFSVVGARYAEAGFAVSEMLVANGNADLHVIVARLAP